MDIFFDLRIQIKTAMKYILTLLALCICTLSFSQTANQINDSTQPEYPGGMEALMSDLTKKLDYPEAENQAKIEGKVFVGFVVDETGTVTNVEVQRGVADHPDFDKAAVHAVRQLKKFKPAEKNGKPCSMSMVLPVKFELD